MLILLVNSHAEEYNNILSAKTNLLIREYREWLDVSELGFLGPILSVISFFCIAQKQKLKIKR